MKLLNLFLMQTSNAVVGAGIYAMAIKDYAPSFLCVFVCVIIVILRRLITNGQTDLYTQKEYTDLKRELEITNQYSDID